MREPRPGESRLELRIPVRPLPDDYLYLCGIFPVTEAEWGRIVAILDAMKPGLVRPDVVDVVIHSATCCNPGCEGACNG